MLKNILLFSLSVFFAVFLCMTYFIYEGKNPQIEEQLNLALKAYQAGEQGKTSAARQEGFKTAIHIYTQLEKHYHPCYSSGKFYYNLGNAYFQVQEYPLAILYYERALALLPTNDDIQHNLEVAMDKLKLPHRVSSSETKRIFAFHYYLSLPIRLHLFFYFSLALLTSLFLILWIPRSKPFLKYIAVFAALGCLLIFSSLIYSRYFEPLEGILIQSTFLYRDKGEQYAKVSPNPSPAGTKAKVVAIQDEGLWLKVVLPDGTLGYVPGTVIRTINCN